MYTFHVNFKFNCSNVKEHIMSAISKYREGVLQMRRKKNTSSKRGPSRKKVLEPHWPKNLAVSNMTGLNENSHDETTRRHASLTPNVTMGKESGDSKHKSKQNKHNTSMSLARPIHPHTPSDATQHDVLL